MLLRTIVVYNYRQFTLYSLIYALLRTYVMLLYIYLKNSLIIHEENTKEMNV